MFKFCCICALKFLDQILVIFFESNCKETYRFELNLNILRTICDSNTDNFFSKADDLHFQNI